MSENAKILFITIFCVLITMFLSINWRYSKVEAVSLEEDLVPTGMIITFADATTPANYLICDGRAVSRTTYADLFQVIGTTYGSGDGSTTFNLPDFSGKTAVYLDSSDSDLNKLGNSGGANQFTISEENMPAHTHTIPSHTHDLSNHVHDIPQLTGTTNSAGKHGHNFPTGTTPTGSYLLRGWDGNNWKTLTSLAAGDHSHTVTLNASTTLASQGNTGSSTEYDTASAGSGKSVSNLEAYMTVYYLIHI